ncbi:MAG TPA: carbonic anhydrase [Gemmatimonadaceae bacterium]|nr:carbonic anhydrase [Gemmatimonadaceae bacterium]
MFNKQSVRGEIKRREFLRSTATAAAVAVGARVGAGVGAGVGARWGISVASAEDAPASGRLSPEAALDALAAGNQRYVGNRMTSGGRDLSSLRQRTIDKQTPFAAVLACADSRVPVELLFDQSIGDVFVTRVAGNIATPEIIASLEYGVAVLGVSALVVLGHTHCGAVKAAMKADAVPGQISALYAYLRPAVEQSAGNVETAIEANSRLQATLLRSSSPVIRDAVAARTLKVATGVYDIGTGKVTLG